MPRPRALVLGLALLGSPALPLAAQASIHLDPDRSVPWAAATTLATPTYVQAVAADLTGDALEDVVLRSDQGQLTLLFGPDVFHARTPVHFSNASYTSLAAFPSGGDETDTLLACGTAGLVEFAFQRSSGAFTPPQVLDSAWVDHVDLRVERFLGSAYVFAIDAGGQTVHSLKLDPTSVVPGPTWSAGAPLLDYAVFDFDGDGLEEVLLLTQHDLFIHDELGGGPGDEASSRRAGGGAFGALAPVQDAGGTSLAMLTSLPSGDLLLACLYAPDGAEAALPLSFPLDDDTSPSMPLGFVGMDAGDLNGDGNDDVVITDRDRARSVVLLNQVGSETSTPRFRAGTLGVDHRLLANSRTPSEPTTMSVCPPLIADVDGNGVGDVVQASGASRTLLLFTDTGLDGLYFASEADDISRSASSYVQIDGTSGQFNLAFQIRDYHLDFDAVQVVVTEQPGQDSTPVLQQATSNTIFYLLTDPEATIQIAPIPIPHPGLVWEQPWHFYVYYRFVNLTTTPQGERVLGRRSFRPGGMTLRRTEESDDPAQYGYLDDLGPGSRLWYLYEPGFTVGNTSLGAFTFDIQPPPLEDGDVPIFPSPTFSHLYVEGGGSE